jgi:nucleoside transporter
MSKDSAPLAESQTKPSRTLLGRLSVMMFLQYFVQGCYLPVVSVYLEEALGFNKRQIGDFGSALAVGPLFAPFVLGQLVDRRFATQYVLAVCHLAGGGVMLMLYFQQTYWPVVVLGTLYSVLYVPTMMLTNSLAFHHLGNQEREFPIVRVWGTIGFIVPAWLIELVFLRGLTGEALNSGRGIVLAAAGVGGIMMAIYSLTLPHTPPSKKARQRFAPAVALNLIRQRRFLVLVIIGFLIAIVHKFYFVLNAPYLKSLLRSGGIEGAWEGRISSLGQIAEIAVMAALGFLIVRFGFKRTITLGAIAYLVRCLVFALAYQLDMPFAATMTVVCLGQLLHGLCFGCFLAASFIFVDRTTPADIRGSVQNLYGTFVIGSGFFAGGIIAGRVGEYFKTGTGDSAVYDWFSIWLAAAGLAAVCVVGFALAFPKKHLDSSDEDG